MIYVITIDVSYTGKYTPNEILQLLNTSKEINTQITIIKCVAMWLFCTQIFEVPWYMKGGPSF